MLSTRLPPAPSVSRIDEVLGSATKGSPCCAAASKPERVPSGPDIPKHEAGAAAAHAQKDCAIRADRGWYTNP